MGEGLAGSDRDDSHLKNILIAGTFERVGTALSVALAVGFSTGPLIGVLAGPGGGLVMVAMLAVIHRVPAVRHVVMELMHRITGQ